MKRISFVLLLLVSAAWARADWKNVKEGVPQQTVLRTVGAPLMMTKSKTGLQVTWTYDRGGYILFEAGRVRYWQAPRPAKREMVAVATVSR